MSKILAILDIDEDKLKYVSDHATTYGAFECEMGWASESGIIVDDYIFVTPEKAIEIFATLNKESEE